MTEGASRDWFSIRAASRFLGVHIGTVREWADAGILPSYRTPGGHRRFTAFDLRTFLERQQKSHPVDPFTSISETGPSDDALECVRQALSARARQQPFWFQQLGIQPTAVQRHQQREFGQQLLEAVVGFVESPDEREPLLDRAQHIARAYGRTLAASELSAGNAARAAIHFRQLILKTILDAQLGSRKGDEEDARLFQRVSAFLDEILLAILDAFP